MLRSALYLCMCAAAVAIACGPAARAGGPGPTPTPIAPATPTPAAGPYAGPPPPALRLPEGVAPTRYSIFLDVDPEVEAFRGIVRIELAISRPTSFVWLHAEGLTVRSVALLGAGGEIAGRAIEAPGGYLGIELGKELPAGAATLEIGYEGKLDSVRSQGLYRVKEPDGKWYAYTFFEPIDARRVFPCFDEPGFKVPWKLGIRTPNGNVAVANTPGVEKKEGDQHALFTFEETRPLPSYLVAFMVGPFDIVEAGTAGHHGTPLRFILPQGRAGELGYAKQVTSKVVGLLEDWFGMPYPYGKLDVAVVPRYWGTMEHPGIVAMGQPLTLIKPEEDTYRRRKAYANILIHELGHYWFGDYVTMAWWNETWLNEGMGTWIDIKITEQLEPAWNYQRKRQASLDSALSGDSTGAAKALRQPIVEPHDVENAFDGSLTYSKGAAILFMFERWIGEAKFQKAIRRYLAEHAWGSVVSEHLLAAISAEAGVDLAPAFKTFLDQPGAPIVTVELVCVKGQAPRVKLAQQRFWPLGSAPKTAEPQLWQIPLCVRYGKGKTSAEKCDLLTTVSAEWTLGTARTCPDWLVGNAARVGYYRVGYTPAGRAALARHARAALTPAERLGFISDTTSLVRAGELRLGELLELGASMANDPDFVVANTARGVLGWVDPDELPAELLPNYKRLIVAVYGPHARRLGWTEKVGESNDDHDLRLGVVSTVAIWGEDAKLRAEASKLALAWLVDRKAIAPDVVGSVLGVASRYGDRALFDAFLAEARKTQDREDRVMLLGALSGFRAPELIAAAQALALSREFDIRDGRSLFFAGLGDPATREQAWTFIKTHFDDLLAQMRDDEKMGALRLAGAFCDVEHRQDAEAFFTPRAAKINGGPRTLARVLEGVDQCIAQREKNAPDIAAFMKKY